MCLKILITLLICVVASPASVLVTFTEAENSNGLWEYEYTAHNEGSTEPGFNLFALSFELPFAPISVTTPASWTSMDSGSGVDAFSLLPGAMPIGADVGPGQSLGGFVFLFNQRIGATPFTAAVAYPDDTVLIGGMTTPEPVAEPASALLVMGGGFACYMYLRRKRSFGV